MVNVSSVRRCPGLRGGRSPRRLLISELGRLRVRPKGSMRGYARVRFGPPRADRERQWLRHAHVTCLRARPDKGRGIGQAPVASSSSGVLRDPYTGTTIRFTRGIRTSTAAQGGHVVAFADAWRTGTSSWTPTKRLRYANDPVVLLAVDGPANKAKSDDDTSDVNAGEPALRLHLREEVDHDQDQVWAPGRTVREARAPASTRRLLSGYCFSLAMSHNRASTAMRTGSAVLRR